METSIATVCISGPLSAKLHAIAAAGFDGIELFEPDLIAAPESPEEIRALAARLGLRIDLYQPLRDVEGVSEEEFARVLHRADAKFALMQRLGVGTVLACSNVATAVTDDLDVSAAQLRRLGELAAGRGIRIAFEALAWGRHIDDYRTAWEVVRRADHPAVGVCLDSFHILSRRTPLEGIAEIPGDRIFFVQLADAPALSLDVLSWSRHHRLFPGEGAFELADLTRRVLDAGYRGPLSLEVFNDTFRQTDPVRTAAQARRSLRWLEDAVARIDPDVPDLQLLPDSAAPAGVAFVEIKGEDTSGFDRVLAAAGFTAHGRHRSKAVTLWTSGRARIVLNEERAAGLAPRIAAVGFDVDDADAVTRRLTALGVPRVDRRRLADEADLPGTIAPDGTEVYWSQAADAGDPEWAAEFGPVQRSAAHGVTRVDHVSLTQPWQVIDETRLFLSAAFALEPQGSTDVPGPAGLVQSHVFGSPDGAVRLPLNVAPPLSAEAGRDGGPVQHIAFACDDVIALARALADAGVAPLPVPANYYDDLAARFALPESTLDGLRAASVLYDADADGSYLHVYTRTIGGVFFEFVERRGHYDGYGPQNAAVRLTAQQRAADRFGA
ncbi:MULTISPECIES: bifunctional sugar phosphate isomerase/epimerase/4-hydroxyphenylpyruvate dioxygenase family protein [Microbacterium]|uniref:bifunctional sugar phosphate isomerase/epimerase/4-hydroxyphenylpyruvate dioxygenase family protein n=1 Tax=Microbacterium TaxID=33882 RepID=UPI0010F73CCF|nr:sugar phosphate isomerase/epimerase and 4-hydroxyphenylpyruvate domain-containing protein [Microbacterium sp. 4NA327F11]MCK9914167.1 TIM barrel protein [Microbacteriaceae bacterium K1510]